MVWQEPHVKMRWIDAQEVQSIEPRLSPAVIGAVYEDESAPAGQLPFQPGPGPGAPKSRAPKSSSREVTGLIARGSTVIGVKTASGDMHCGAVVVAAGSWSQAFTPWLGFPVPVRPMKGRAPSAQQPRRTPAGV